MKITREEVERVAVLARLKLSHEDTVALTDQLDKILQYVEKLNQLDTGNVEPLAHAVDIVNAFRRDQVIPSPPTEDLLRNAPATEDSFFRVPKIIE